MGPMQCGISGVCQETESGVVYKCMNQDHKLLERGSLCRSLWSYLAHGERLFLTPGELLLFYTWGAWGELVNDVLPAKEESKGASSKKWHATKAHLKKKIKKNSGEKIWETHQNELPNIDNKDKSWTTCLNSHMLISPELFKIFKTCSNFPSGLPLDSMYTSSINSLNPMYLSLFVSYNL